MDVIGDTSTRELFVSLGGVLLLEKAGVAQREVNHTTGERVLWERMCLCSWPKNRHPAVISSHLHVI